MRFILCGLLVASIILFPTLAQRPGPNDLTLKFDVASVRLNTSGNNRGYNQIQPGGGVAITNLPLREIIAFAYGIDFSVLRFSLIGGSSKLLDAHFDIHGVPPRGDGAQRPPRRDESLLMLRALLAERFDLQMKKETREVPTYVLTIAKPPKLGAYLHRSDHDCAVVKAARRNDPNWAPGRSLDDNALCAAPTWSQPKAGVVTLKDAGPVETLIKAIQGHLDRKVVNETKLTGNLEWSVTFSINPSDEENPPLSVALQDELGLKLENRIRPAEVYVIESLAMPTSN